MKKTIVAAAVAAVFAAPVAMADVKISGAVQVEGGEFDDTNASDTSADSDIRSMSDIKFSGSEDLGNGMKAGFSITMTADNQADSGAEDKFVTLSGDFGTIKAGNFEMYVESSVTAMAANDASHDVSNEISDGEYTVGASGQTVQYTSPSINGVTVVAQTADNADSVGIQYSGNGLLVRAATESNVGGNDVDAFAIQYSMNGLTGKVVNVDNGSGDDKTWFGLEYAMGNNKIAYSVVDAATADGDGDSTLSLSHAMSKQTTVYLVLGTDDSNGSDDETVVGIKHSF